MANSPNRNPRDSRNKHIYKSSIPFLWQSLDPWLVKFSRQLMMRHHERSATPRHQCQTLAWWCHVGFKEKTQGHYFSTWEVTSESQHRPLSDVMQGDRPSVPAGPWRGQRLPVETSVMMPHIPSSGPLGLQVCGGVVYHSPGWACHCMLQSLL